jgi:hypothetical protein
MSAGPPFDNETSDTTWPDWEEKTTALDYPERDIRILFPEERSGTVHKPHVQPPDFGDFDPSPYDPDPNIWPIKEVDPGYPADVDDLILLANSFPAPHVAWVTEEYIENRYGYSPVCQEVRIDELPPWARPEDPGGTGTVEVMATNETSNSMSLTNDRAEALERLARLWNGDVVRGHHLLLDKGPDWMDIFGDLDQDELRRFIVDPTVDIEFAEAFGTYNWYELEQDVYTKPARIIRKKIWYAPTQRGRTLINENAELPDLNGDPNEGLVHRFSVGLAVVWQILQGRRIGTYVEDNNDVVDILSKDENENYYVGEVMTGHHNWKLHRRTHQKMRRLHERGINPYVVFDSRETAYEIFNHWQREGLCELPGGTFNSEFAISKGQEKVRTAYESEEFDWIVSDWTTTSDLWDKTIGPDGPQINTEKIKSTTW